MSHTIPCHLLMEKWTGKLSDFPSHPEPPYQHAQSTDPGFTKSVPLNPHFPPTDEETEIPRGHPWKRLSSLQELSVLCGLSQSQNDQAPPLGVCPLPLPSSHPAPALGHHPPPNSWGPGRLEVFLVTSHCLLPRETCADPPRRQERAELCCTGGWATPPSPLWPSMEALVCAFSELRIREGARLWGGLAGGEMSSVLTWAQSHQGGFRDMHAWERGLALI